MNKSYRIFLKFFSKRVCRCSKPKFHGSFHETSAWDTWKNILWNSPDAPASIFKAFRRRRNPFLHEETAPNVTYEEKHSSFFTVNNFGWRRGVCVREGDRKFSCILSKLSSDFQFLSFPRINYSLLRFYSSTPDYRFINDVSPSGNAFLVRSSYP